MLTQLAEDLWVAHHPMRMLGLRLGTRMTIVRLPSGDLLLHSPIPPNDALRSALDELGQVAALVGPNRFHHLFLGHWAEAYPDAQLFGAPGLAEKRKRLAFDAVLTNQAPELWAEVIDQHLIQGAPKLNEVAFFHRPSHTLILTDWLFNFSHCAHWWTRWMLRFDGAYGQPALSRLTRLLVRDRPSARASIERLLAWEFQRIVLAHGQIVETTSHRMFEQAMRWLPSAALEQESAGADLLEA